jgi:hypothetical protein
MVRLRRGEANGLLEHVTLWGEQENLQPILAGLDILSVR